MKNIIDRLNEYSAKHQSHGGICAEAADYIKELEERVKYAETGWGRALDSMNEFEGKCQEATYRAESAEKRVNEYEALVMELLGDAYDIDRLRELVQADQEGRCKIHAMKDGDTAYSIFAYINGLHIRRSNGEPIKKITTYAVNDLMRNTVDREFGKTVFATREAAEQALKEVEKDG